MEEARELNEISVHNVEMARIARDVIAELIPRVRRNTIGTEVKDILDDCYYKLDQLAKSSVFETMNEVEFYNGDKVKFKPEYGEDETLTVSQADPEDGRCWVGDKDGAGWSATFDQLIIVKRKTQY